MGPLRLDPVRTLTRAARRFYYRLHAQGVPVVYDARYQHGLLGVPMDPLRGDKVLGTLEEAGLLSRKLLSEPRPASLHNLLRVHTPEYLQALQEPETLTRILGIEVPPDEVETTLDLQRLMAGGTIQATRLAMRTGGVALHLGGGFHHAMPDAGLGFCVFNDIAVAILRLRARGFEGPVLVIDLDLHDGNGTRRVFAADPTVHTFSVHNEHWGDTDAVESTSIALGAGVDDELYLQTLREALPPLIARLRPAARDLRRGHRRRARRRDRQLADQRRRRLRARPAGDVSRAHRAARLPDGGGARGRVRPQGLALHRALRAVARGGSGHRAARRRRRWCSSASAGSAASCATPRAWTTACPSRSTRRTSPA